MIRSRSAPFFAAVCFGAASTAFAEGVTPEVLTSALAEAKSAGKPMLVIAGHEG